ncbi:MAG: potassium transporter TrkG [Gallionellaceae bacterium]|nr:potassium transporter TrkG [Gallionellaceae bacterium]
MEGEGIRSLIHPVRWPVLGRYLGQLAVVLSLLTLPPFGVALWFGEYPVAWRYLAVIVGLAGAAAWLTRLQAPDRLQDNEAMVIVALAFVLTPLLMTFPLAAAGLAWTDAWFEAVSGITTTGLSTLVDVAGQSASLLFTRAWMQWYGGLGIAVLAVVLLAQHGPAARKLAEPAGAEVQASSTRVHARRVLAVYLLLSLAGLLLIWGAGMAPFDALLHALAAVSTGGFSSFNGSLAPPLPTAAAFAVVFTALLGAVSLPLYYFAYRRGLRELLSDLEFRALLLASLFLSLILAAWFSWHGMAPVEAVRNATLLALSAQTTAGFSPLDVAGLDAFPKGLLILAMATGGSVASTAGGIKLLRLLIFLRLIQLVLRRSAVSSHAVVEPRLAGHRLEAEEIIRVLSLIGLFALVVVLSWLVFLGYGYPPLDALFEVVSAVGTVGLSAGLTGPDLPAALKWLLCLDMLAGRLEIVALLVTLYPVTWFGKAGGE